MIALSLLVTLVLIVLNGFFSASEMSLVNARHTRLQAAADEGDEGAKMALKVASDSDRLLATIQVFITLLGFFASAVSATTLSEPLSAWAQGALGIDQAIGRPVATVLITLLVSYVSIVVGELLPKRIALSNPERVAARLAGPVAACEKIARPLVWITAASSNGLAKLFGIPSAEERQDVSEEEIRYIVADANELLDDEKRMIHEIMKLGDARAHDIMTPRADIIFAEDTDSVRQTLDRMRGTGYSRLPVFHEDHDRIVGVVMYKDLVPALLDDREDDPVGDYATEAYFVPETKDIFPMLSEMQTSRQQMAIVVDEYGGTDGLITVEDILEEIVGEIVDETDLESKYVTQLTDGEWLVDGNFPVEDAIELGWPLEKSEDYDTIAGWLLDTVDTIPQVGDSFDVSGFRFEVRSMRRHRIRVVRVKRLDDEGESPSAEENE